MKLFVYLAAHVTTLRSHSAAVISCLHRSKEHVLEVCRCNCRKADSRTENVKQTLDNFSSF